MSPEKPTLTGFQRRILKKLLPLRPGTEQGRRCTGAGVRAAFVLADLKLAVRVATLRFARTELGDAWLADEAADA